MFLELCCGFNPLSCTEGGRVRQVTLFVGSHNLTPASQANHECVVQLGTVQGDANVAAYREWLTRLWDISSPPP